MSKTCTRDHEANCGQCEQGKKQKRLQWRKPAAQPEDAETARKLHGHADGWRYRPEPGALAWRV